MKKFGLILMAAGIAFSSDMLHAQTASLGGFNNDLGPVQAAQPDSIVQITAEAEGLSPIDPTTLPFFASCYWTVYPGTGPVPLPCPPQDLSVPIYEMADGIYLVDQTGGSISVSLPQRANATQAALQSATVAAVDRQGNAIADLIEQVQTTAANQQTRLMARAMGLDVPSPGGDDGGGSYSPNGLTNSFVAPDYGTNLWIAQTYVADGYLAGIGSNTIADVQYEIQSRTNLSQIDWQSEGFIYGSELTNWTPLSVTQNGRSNLFLRLRSWDDDGSGLPIWWQLQYFGTTGIDPGATDSSGDGFTVWQKFRMGVAPNVFYTPPGPQGVAVTVNSATSATFTWQPAQGAVTGYTVGRYDQVTAQSQTFNIGPTSQFQDSSFIPYPPWVGQIYYSVQANYTNGNSDWSDSVGAGAPNNSVAQVYSGAGGSLVLKDLNIPADASGVQATRVDWSNRSSYPPIVGGTNTFFIPVSAFANGLYSIPSNAVGSSYDGSSWYVQAVWSNGVTSTKSAFNDAGYLEAQTTYGGIPSHFNDCSTQLEQNAVFLLRAAGLNSPFLYSFDAGYGMTPVYQATNYTYSSFWNMNYDTGDGLGDASVFFWGLPIEENYRLANFVYSSSNVDSSGFLNTGTDGWNWWDTGSWTYALPAPYKFSYSTTNTTTAPSLLSASQATWITPYDDPGMVGITVNSGKLQLPNGITNWFGLKLLSVLVAHNHNSTLYTDTLNSGGSLTATNDTYYFYPNYDQPQLQTVGYYFGLPNNNQSQNGSQLLSSPLPGNNDFSPTNAQPILIGSVGTLMQVAAFAKQKIVNGDTTKPVYVGQYFDKAYKIDANGNVTSTQTGVLSPYGYFLPTEPGPVALVTMPASDGQRGTGVVQVISLALDANHDGNMDLTLGGSDYATGNQGMSFWVNDLYDKPGSGSTLDQTMPVYQGNTSTGQIQPNYAYGQIRCQRNLENFGRLWIRGMPKLPASQGYSITLGEEWYSWGGAVNLYKAYEANGGIRYLTDTNIAAAQVAAPYGNKLASLAYWYPEYVLPEDAQGNLLLTNFLFEGSGAGSDGLTLSIYQNGLLIGQSEVRINFDEVQNLYEQAQVTNVVQTWPEMVQTNTTSGFQVLHSPPPNPNEAKELALFVHGWRMTAWDWEKFTGAMFKRFYWQGFQGRFASLRWPTRSKDSDPLPYLDLATYNRSEHIAFKSAPGAAAYFSNLRQRYTNYTISAMSHSMGNILMMEALKELAASNQAPLDNYALMQAAVPAHCYDPNVANLPSFITIEQTVPTPNIYRNYGSNITHALRSGGQLINFFNPDDYALAYGVLGSGLGSWEYNESFYDDQVEHGPVSMKPNTFLGYTTDGTNSLLSQNYWNQAFSSIIYGGYYSSGVTRSVTNLQELMAFVARPRSKAVGAQASVQGQIQGGEVNLKTAFGFGGASTDHSGQFNRNIQDSAVVPFYNQLRQKMFPIP